MTFANPFHASAYLLRKERRHRYRTIDGAIDPVALSMAKRLLPTTPEVTQKQREHLLRVVDRIEKAAVAWAALAEAGLLDERFGFPIVIEVPNGGVRRGISADGIAWEAKLEGCAYGFLLDTVARDEEEIDIIVGPDPSADDAFIIAQMVPPGPYGSGGELDEYKLAVGFSSYELAEQCYASNWGQERIGQILTMPIEVLRGLLGFELDEGLVAKALEVVVGGNSNVLALGPNGVVVGRVEKVFATDKVAPERYAHIDFRPPEGVREAARRGLALHDEGKTGDGIEPATIAWARRIADGEAVSPEKARQGNRWFGRNERFKDEPKDSPAWAAWMLWFGEDGQSWFGKLVEQMDAADRSAKGVNGLSTFASGGQLLPQQGEEAKAVWSTAEINTRPDSAFLYIEPGGEKDAEGKTVPRTLRHFVYRDAEGNIDLPHLRNAIARAPQANLPKEVIARVQEEARRLLDETTASARKAQTLAGLPAGVAKALDSTLAYRGCTHSVTENATIASHPALHMQLTGYYSHPDDVGGWRGWIEPDNRAWIAFVDVNGRVLLWTDRDNDGGVRGEPYEFVRPDLAIAVLEAKQIANVKLCAVEKNLDMSTPIDRRIVYGIALEPEPFEGRGDAHDETYSADVIRRAAYGWLASFATFDDSHGRFLTNQEIVPVESFIAPCDFTMNGSHIRAGSWVVAAKICSDALWQRILNRELNAWSIEGHAIRECGRCAAALIAKKMSGGVKWLCPACDRSELISA